jgi:hypothetical protein
MIHNPDGSISCCRDPQLRGGCCVNCGTWKEDLELDARFDRYYELVSQAEALVEQGDIASARNLYAKADKIRS